MWYIFSNSKQLKEIFDYKWAQKFKNCSNDTKTIYFDNHTPLFEFLWQYKIFLTYYTFLKIILMIYKSLMQIIKC